MMKELSPHKNRGEQLCLPTRAMIKNKQNKKKKRERLKITTKTKI